MAYVWSKDLETGNAMIDSQHKELIEAINALLAACATGKGRAEVAKTTKCEAGTQKIHRIGW